MTRLSPPHRWQWWMHEWRELRDHRLRLPAWTWRALVSTALLAVVLFASPYWTLWRLSQAATSATPEALAPFVDLDAVRTEIRHRLNKDVSSHIGEVSDPFIEWIEQGLKRKGTTALDSIVSLEWIAGRLHGGDRKAPLLKRVRYAFYDPPHGFLIKIEHQHSNPTVLLLSPAPLIWRITAVYY